MSSRRSLLRFLSLLAIVALGGIPLHARAQTVQIAFTPATIQSGASSRLTITLGNNSATGANATLVQTLTDSLPAGLVVANPTVIGGSCEGTQAAGGARSLSYPAGAVIPAGGCTIQVNVTGTSATHTTFYTDSIPAGALQTTLGNNAQSASGTLTVQSGAVVPSIVGLTQAQAATALQSAGLTLGTITKAPGPGNIPYNAIFAQNPAAGTAVASGSAVAVSISTGAGLATNPNRPLTSVQNFVVPYQQSEAAALERLCAAVENADPTTLTAAQRNLSANCGGIIGTYGGGVNAAGLKQTLDALSGHQTTAEERTGVQFSGAQFTNLGTRLAQLRQGLSGVSFAGLDLGLPAGDGLSMLAEALDDSLGGGARGGGTGSGSTRGGGGFFVNGSLRRGSQDVSTLESPFDFRSDSVTAGLDYRFTNHLIFGVALGHSSGNTEFTDGTGRQDSRGNSISLYGTFYDEAFYVDMMGTFAHLSYRDARDTSFSINPATIPLPTNCVASGSCSVDTTGSTGARQFALNTNVGYSFNQGAFTYGPDVAVNFTHIQVNGFTENDPDVTGLGLVYGDDTGESLQAKAGGHMSYAIKVPFGVLLPEARAHYVHEFKNDQRALSVHFSADPDANSAGGPVSNFVVFTDPPDRGFFEWAAGFSAQFAFGIAAFAEYDSLTDSYQRVHEFAAGIRIEHQVR
jgi:uncharacterized protein YhjY with autotransporter beta-barrel domain